MLINRLWATNIYRQVEDSKSLIIRACKMGNHRALVDLLEMVDPKEYHILQELGRSTLLHYASHQGWLEIAQQCLDEFKCDIEARNHENGTALHVACFWGRSEVALLLLDRGADCTVISSFNSTPLHGACRHNLVNVAKVLLSRGASVNIPSNVTSSPLVLCCRYGSLELLHLLLDHLMHDFSIDEVSSRNNRRDDVTVMDFDGGYPVLAAVENENFDILKELLRRGFQLYKPDVHVRRAGRVNWSTNESIKRIYSHPQHVELLKLWLKLPTIDTRGYTYELFQDIRPIINAFKGNNDIGLQAILDNGGFVLEDASHALHGHIPGTSVLEVLLSYMSSHGIQPRIDNRGRTPLHNLGRNGHMQAGVHGNTTHREDIHEKLVDIMKLFVEYGSDINSVDADGRTLLYYLMHPTCQDCFDLALIAIELGADEVVDKWELSPLEYLTDLDQRQKLRDSIQSRPMQYVLK